MRKRGVFYFLGLLLALQFSNAQKVIKKSIVNTDISHIRIDVKNCFGIDLATSDSDVLVIEAQFDGEYEKDLLLNISEKGSTIVVSADLQPNFVKPNDKLSAHKVISVALKVILPKQKDVHVFGSNCNVIATGVYDFLKVSLNDGRCDLINVSEAVEVNTHSGHISAKYSQAAIRAKSKYGKVIGTISKKGNSDYNLSTVTGDIHLKRVE